MTITTTLRPLAVPAGAAAAVRRGGRAARRGATKRRSGCACLIVSLVLAGGLGGLGYFGYGLYQDHFAAAPDFSGEGSGSVQVEVPEGTPVNGIGAILKEAGVVKSVDAFVAAATDNPKAQTIHPGSYTLRKEMSAAAAIELMLNPETTNALTFPEGRRATETYQKIDEHLELKKGSTAKVARAEVKNLGLPEWALNNENVKDPLEGFLFPATYSVGKKTKPETVLKEMVKRANSEYTKAGLVEGAEKVGRTPHELVTIASLIAAEGQTEEEFRKVSRVVYNRLEPDNTETYGKIDFDSTINYAKGKSNLNISNQDTQFDDLYNTYRYKGLPPGPIDNPGADAIDAALNPAEGDWMYFVTVEEGDTRFSDTKAEHDKHVAEFNRIQQEKDQ